MWFRHWLCFDPKIPSLGESWDTQNCFPELPPWGDARPTEGFFYYIRVKCFFGALKCKKLRLECCLRLFKIPRNRGFSDCFICFESIGSSWVESPWRRRLLQSFWTNFFMTFTERHSRRLWTSRLFFSTKANDARVNYLFSHHTS